MQLTWTNSSRVDSVKKVLLLRTLWHPSRTNNNNRNNRVRTTWQWTPCMSQTLLMSSKQLKQRRLWCSIVRPTQVRPHTQRTPKLSNLPSRSWIWVASSLNWDTLLTCRMVLRPCKNEMACQLWRKRALRLSSTRKSVISTWSPHLPTCRLWSRSAQCSLRLTRANPTALQACLKLSAHLKKPVKRLRPSETNYPSCASSRSSRGSSDVVTEYSAMAGDMVL